MRRRKNVSGAKAMARLVRYPFGAVVGGPSGEILMHCDWQAPEEATPFVFPRAVSTRTDLGEMFGSWHWQEADRIDLDEDVRGELGVFLEELRGPLAAGDPEPLIELSRPRLKDLARAYSLPPGQKERQIRDVTELDARQPWWGMQPLEPESYAFRLCGRGRLVELVGQDWEPVLKENPDEDGSLGQYGMFVGRLDGEWTILRTLEWVQILNGKDSPFTRREKTIGSRILKEIHERLTFLEDVGLDYLTLQRKAASLSGGEAQRIRLATQIGSRLMGVLYVLDEPSIGLHPRDNTRLLRTLQGLRDLGNTVLVVEHDEETIRTADWVVDLGPGAGEHGGEVVAEGPVDVIEAHGESLTGAYLTGRMEVPLPAERRTGNGKALMIIGAKENNLKEIDVKIPLEKLVCITGVSGSGKSTLMVEVLYKALARQVHRSRQLPGAYERIEGCDLIDKVINIDQSPIGRTPRSNPGTYTGLFDHIRKLFAELPESKIRGYKPGRFSFNVRGGRCEACEGQGQLRIEMQFLPDVYVPCDVCHGSRYNRETLQVRFKEYNIAEILEMTVSTALEVFSAFPAMVRKLKTLNEVGLGYIIRWGGPAGEAGPRTLQTVDGPHPVCFG